MSQEVKYISYPDGATSLTTGETVLAGEPYTDLVTASNGTTDFNAVYIPSVVLNASNTSVTATTASSLRINGTPTAGTNVSLGASYGMYVDARDNMVTGRIILGSTPASGPLAASGQYFSLRQPSVTDTVSAASSTNNTAWSGAWIQAPTVNATNTAVSYSAPVSTVTIVGAPIAGTNVTFTNNNNYALNVQSGNSYLGGDARVVGNISAANLPTSLPTPTLTYTNLSSTTLTGVSTIEAYLDYNPTRTRYTLQLAFAVTFKAAGTGTFNFVPPNKTSNFGSLFRKGTPYAVDSTGTSNYVCNVSPVNGATSASVSLYSPTATTVNVSFECSYQA